MCKFVLDLRLYMCNTFVQMKIDKYTLIYRESIDDLSAALEEKESLEDRLQEVIAKIDDLRQVAYSTANMCGVDPRVEYPSLFLEETSLDIGFTDAIRGVFSPGVGMSPVQVRNRLRAGGFDLKGYKNPLATIHTILKRLVKAGELFVMPQDEEDGPTLYIMPPTDRTTTSKTVNALNAPSTDGIQPSQEAKRIVIRPGEPVTKILRRKDPRWWEYIKQSGGIILSNPPYFANGKRLTVRQRRELKEAIGEKKD